MGYLSHEALSIRLSRKGNLSDTVNPASNRTTTKKPVKSLNLKPYDLSSFRAFTSAILLAWWLFTCFFVKTSTSLDRCEHSFWTRLCWRLLLLICALFAQTILSGHDMPRHNWRHWGYRGWSKWQSVYCRPHCPVELSLMMELFCICAISYLWLNSHVRLWALEI